MAKQKDETLSGGLAAAALLACIVGVVLAGFVGATLWGWFLVPLGLPAITIAHAIGIDALVTFWVGPNPILFMEDFVKPVKSLQDRTAAAIGRVLGVPLGILLLGWIATLFL